MASKMETRLAALHQHLVDEYPEGFYAHQFAYKYKSGVKLTYGTVKDYIRILIAKGKLEVLEGSSEDWGSWFLKPHR